MHFNSNFLESKTILITGATSGIGRACALKSALYGAQVICLGRNTQSLDDLSSQMTGNIHHFMSKDISSVDGAYDAFMDARNKVETIDYVLHCAGAELFRISRLTKSSHVQDVMGASLLGGLGIARAVSKKKFISENGGSIVFMSSVAAQRGQTGFGAYGAAKAGLLGLTKSLACELSSRQIRVNCIVSGAVETGMHDRAVRSMDIEKQEIYKQKHLLGFGEVADIVNPVMFLFSDASKWITGTDLVIDGGYMAKS